MNGPDHYRAAEVLLEDAANPQRWITGLGVDDFTPDQLKQIGDAMQATVAFADTGVSIVDQRLAAAQVHATLALTAATAAGRLTEANSESHAETYIEGDDSWRAVIA